MRSDRAPGQAMVEFALTLSLFALFVMVVIQFSLLFITYYSETELARQTARWLAVNSRTTTDDVVAAHLQSIMLPGLVNGSPSNLVYGTATTPASATVGGMSLQYTPCIWNGTVCTDADRASGSTLYVQLRYDVAGSHILFLPSTFRVGSLVVKIPTQLPPYKVSVMVE